MEVNDAALKDKDEGKVKEILSIKKRFRIPKQKQNKNKSFIRQCFGNTSVRVSKRKTENERTGGKEGTMRHKR